MAVVAEDPCGLGRSVAAVLWAALVPFLVLALYARASLDDYCIAERLAAEGFVGAQVWWYEQWTGKFFCMLGTTAFSSQIGFDHYWVAPLALFVLLCAALFAAVRAVSGGSWSRRASLASAGLLAVVTVVSVPHPQESVYWLTGAWAYAMGAIVMLALFAAVVSRPTGVAGRVAVGALAFVAAVCACGCNEGLMVVLVCASGMAAVTAVARRASLPSAAWTAMVGVAVGAAVVVLAPGNQVRAEHFAGAGNWWASLSRSSLWTLGRVGLWSLNGALIGVALLVAPRLPELGSRLWLWRGDRSGRADAGACLGLLAVLVAMVFTVFWATGHKPPGRMRTAVYAVFLLGWFVVLVPGAARALRRRGVQWSAARRVRVARVLIVIGLLQGNLPHAVLDLTSGRAQRYAAEQDARVSRARTARARGSRDLVVTPLSARPVSLFVGDLTEDAKAWENRGFAATFGLATVVARAGE